MWIFYYYWTQWSWYNKTNSRPVPRMPGRVILWLYTLPRATTVRNLHPVCNKTSAQSSSTSKDQEHIPNLPPTNVPTHCNLLNTKPPSTVASGSPNTKSPTCTGQLKYFLGLGQTLLDLVGRTSWWWLGDPDGTVGGGLVFWDPDGTVHGGLVFCDPDGTVGRTQGMQEAESKWVVQPIINASSSPTVYRRSTLFTSQVWWWRF